MDSDRNCPQDKMETYFFSKHIEDRVNQMVRDRDQKGEAGHVYIRVVFIGDKHFETRSGVRKQANELYGANSNQIIEKYKYRAKGLFYAQCYFVKNV